jgi:hypothetical protein
MRLVLELKNRFGDMLRIEDVALLDIIDADLGFCLDSIFRNKMQIEVGHEHSERRLQWQDSTKYNACRFLMMI